MAVCARCRDAVDDQRRLKERMSGVRLPTPPAELHQVLVGIADEPPRHRLVLPRMLLAGAALAGVSAFVLGAAYVLGGVDADGDPVAPGYAALLAAFAPTAEPVETSQVVATPAAEVTPAMLREHGWPCPAELGALVREAIEFSADAVLVHYANGADRLQLHEQVGRLDESALEGVPNIEVAGTRVWVAESDPAVITWQAPGLVLTLITNLSQADWEDVVAQLPSLPIPDAAQRVGSGLDRMIDWVP